MEEKLIVKQVGGDEVGVVTVDQFNQLRATPARPELAAEFHGVISRLASGQLAQMTGDEIVGPEGLAHRTLGTAVAPGDPGYLSALADAVTWSQETIAGARLRAWVDTDRPETS